MKSSVAVTASESGAPEQTHQAPVSATTRWSWRNLVGNTEFQLLVALLVLIGVWAFLYPEVFPTSDNFLNMGRVGSILLVVAIGQMFALVVGGFDLSVAANMGFVSTVVAMHITGGTAFVDGVLLGLAVGAAIGLVNGILIAGLGITPFVATLGTLTFLTGYGNQLSQGQSIASLPSGFQALGGGDWGPLPAAIGIAAITLLVAWIVLARTRIGLYVFAIGGSRETARVSGIAVKRYEIFAYTACGFFAGLAGIMLASRVSVGVTSLGQGYDLLSIATAVIGGVAIGGGIGKLRGVVLGVVLLTVLRNGLDIGGLNEFAQQMITGVVLIVAVLAARTRGIDIAGIFRRGRRGAAGDGSLPAG
ncbi:MAG TPA: ABC transporter permease [Conexibacter sp.]|nr:ABC transporter permease [Conexibacter sp.]